MRRLANVSATPMMMKPLSSSLQRELNNGGGGARLWAEVTELARKPTVVADLAQGYPDFPGSQSAIRSLVRTVQDPSKIRLNQYSLVNGSVDLRQAISDFYARIYANTTSRKMNPATEVLVTTSGTEGLYAAIAAIIDPQDEVVVFDPCFPWYTPTVRLLGGVVKPVKLQWPTFSLPSEEELRRHFTSRTKLVILNTPHNPTGHVLTKQEVERVAKLCREFGTYVLSDEVYEFFVFDKAKKHHRIADEPGLFERTLTVGSASKMLSSCGWRVGWLYGDERLISASKSMHSYMTYCAPTPLQEGVREALADFDPARDADFSYFRDNARRLGDALKKRFPQVEFELPEGGYFLVVNVEKTGMDDVQFCKTLAERHGIVGVPMRVFFSNEETRDPHLVRFAICKCPETIDKAVGALVRGG